MTRDQGNDNEDRGSAVGDAIGPAVARRDKPSLGTRLRVVLLLALASWGLLALLVILVNRLF